MAKKPKICTEEGAQSVLDSIDAFEQSSKGEHGRGRFNNILVKTLESHLFSREVVTNTMSIPKESITLAYQGASTGINPTTRSSFIKKARSAALEVKNQHS